ncbi:MAG: hypothetical protein JO303_00745, partial [Caulobacteraceae bacterium]|nr:hypothetical protein [Caulobacteraceae bacterium]
KAEYLACGMDQVVAKPIEIAELLRTIDALGRPGPSPAADLRAPSRRP